MDKKQVMTQLQRLMAKQKNICVQQNIDYYKERGFSFNMCMFQIIVDLLEENTELGRTVTQMTDLIGKSNQQDCPCKHVATKNDKTALD